MAKQEPIDLAVVTRLARHRQAQGRAITRIATPFEIEFVQGHRSQQRPPLPKEKAQRIRCSEEQMYMTPCAGAARRGNDRLREVEGMAPASNRIGTRAALRIAEQDLADTGKARLHKTRDIVGDVMGEPNREREFRWFRSQRGDRAMPTSRSRRE